MAHKTEQPTTASIGRKHGLGLLGRSKPNNNSITSPEPANNNNNNATNNNNSANSTNASQPQQQQQRGRAPTPPNNNKGSVAMAQPTDKAQQQQPSSSSSSSGDKLDAANNDKDANLPALGPGSLRGRPAGMNMFGALMSEAAMTGGRRHLREVEDKRLSMVPSALTAWQGDIKALELPPSPVDTNTNSNTNNTNNTNSESTSGSAPVPQQQQQQHQTNGEAKSPNLSAAPPAVVPRGKPAPPPPRRRPQGAESNETPQPAKPISPRLNLSAAVAGNAAASFTEAKRPKSPRELEREKKAQKKQEKEKDKAKEKEREKEKEKAKGSKKGDKKLRKMVISEMVTTEADYVRDLKIIQSLYINPLREKGILDPQDIQSIFLNLSIIFNVSIEVEQELRKLQSDSDGVGKVMLKIADYLKLYTQYCSNQETSMRTIDHLEKKNKAFSQFLDECMLNPVSRSLSINAFLIKPVQRICKYPLLLRELLKYTAEDHPDHADIKAALEKISEVVEWVNKKKAEAEGLQTLIEIQRQISGAGDLKMLEPGRYLIREGTMIKVSEQGKMIEYHFFMCNDILVYVSPQQTFGSIKGNKKKLARKRYTFKGTIDLRCAVIRDIPDREIAFEIREQKVYTLLCKSAEEKKQWLHDFTSAIDYWVSKRQLETPPPSPRFPDVQADRAPGSPSTPHGAAAMIMLSPKHTAAHNAKEYISVGDAAASLSSPREAHNASSISSPRELTTSSPRDVATPTSSPTLSSVSYSAPVPPVPAPKKIGRMRTRLPTQMLDHSPLDESTINTIEQEQQLQAASPSQVEVQSEPEQVVFKPASPRKAETEQVETKQAEEPVSTTTSTETEPKPIEPPATSSEEASVPTETPPTEVAASTEAPDASSSTVMRDRKFTFGFGAPSSTPSPSPTAKTPTNTNPSNSPGLRARPVTTPPNESPRATSPRVPPPVPVRATSVMQRGAGRDAIEQRASLYTSPPQNRQPPPTVSPRPSMYNVAPILPVVSIPRSAEETSTPSSGAAESSAPTESPVIKEDSPRKDETTPELSSPQITTEKAPEQKSAEEADKDKNVPIGDNTDQEPSPTQQEETKPPQPSAADSAPSDQNVVTPVTMEAVMATSPNDTTAASLIATPTTNTANATTATVTPQAKPMAYKSRVSYYAPAAATDESTTTNTRRVRPRAPTPQQGNG